MIPVSIQHVTQPSKHSCMAACLAMVTGLPVEYVRQRLPEPANADECTRFLAHHQVRTELLREDQLWAGHLYIISLCSLNLPGQLHAAVLDWRDEQAPALYDPNFGREGKLTVSLDDFMQGRVGWSAPIRLTDCCELPILEPAPA